MRAVSASEIDFIVQISLGPARPVARWLEDRDGPSPAHLAGRAGRPTGPVGLAGL